MSRYQAASQSSQQCTQCGAPLTVEMDGPWSYRVCTRNGHVQSQGTGPLANAVLLFMARGD